MRLEETFTQEEIKEIRNYIDKVNEFKNLKDEITSNLKVDVKELNIKNIESNN